MLETAPAELKQSLLCTLVHALQPHALAFMLPQLAYTGFTLLGQLLVHSLHGSRQSVHAGDSNSCAEVVAAAALAVQDDREMVHDNGVAHALL